MERDPIAVARSHQYREPSPVIPSAAKDRVVRDAGQLPLSASSGSMLVARRAGM